VSRHGSEARFGGDPRTLLCSCLLFLLVVRVVFVVGAILTSPFSSWLLVRSWRRGLSLSVVGASTFGLRRWCFVGRSTSAALVRRVRSDFVVGATVVVVVVGATLTSTSSSS